VETFGELYSAEDVRNIFVAFLLVPTFAGLFVKVSELKSDDYYATTIPTTPNDWAVMFARSFLVGMTFEEVLGSLTYVRRIFYAPFKVVHPSVMNRPFRSATLAEFWSYRWNRTMHGFFKRNVYLPLLAAPGVTKPAADLCVFFASGLFHVIMLSGSGVLPTVEANASCMLFFLSQAALFAVERRLFPSRPRRGSLANRLFAYASIVLTSPLMFEPVLRLHHL
jgi:hypothetical protein